MRKNYILAFFLVFLLGNICYANSKPEWIDYPYRKCANNEICASGNGNSLNSAKTDARNNILKYFETNVKSTFKSSLSSNEETVKDFSSEDMEELSSGILKGVEIKETFQNKDGFFAFAILNKTIAAKEVANDINKLDSKMKLLLAEKNPKYNKQLEKSYQKREELNKKYLILTGNMIPEVVKYDHIFQNKKLAGDLTYFIEAENNNLEIVNYLESIIVDNNFKITNNKNQANRILVLKINKTDMFLNIDGFIKQKYSLMIRVLDKSSKEIKIINEDFIDTGRNENQIKDSVNVKIKNYFEKNLEEILQ